MKVNNLEAFTKEVYKNIEDFTIYKVEYSTNIYLENSSSNFLKTTRLHNVISISRCNHSKEYFIEILDNMACFYVQDEKNNYFKRINYINYLNVNNKTQFFMVLGYLIHDYNNEILGYK